MHDQEKAVQSQNGLLERAFEMANGLLNHVPAVLSYGILVDSVAIRYCYLQRLSTGLAMNILHQ